MVDTSLPAQLEEYFKDYELQLFKGGLPVNYGLWMGEVWRYFDQWYTDADMIDDIFNGFGATWGLLYQIGQFAAADTFWEMPIGFAHQWEADRRKTLHKGTPYYFRGMAAVMNGNIDRGFLFFHQALEEERKIRGRGDRKPILQLGNLLH